MHLTLQMSWLGCVIFFSKSVFQFGFLPSKPCLFSLESNLQFILHHGKPKFSLVFSPLMDQSFSSVIWPEVYPYNNLHTNCCVCIFFLNPAAEILLNMVFNTLLKIKPNNMERRRSKERIKCTSGSSRQYSWWVTHPVSYPAQQGLT